MAFTPFMQGSEAQGIISNYLGGGYDTTSASPFRNPIFDIRTQQELAGELDPSALYPNPQIDFSVDETVDPCPEGFMLVDGVCQPIEQFGQSDDYSQSGRTEDDPEGLYIPTDEEILSMNDQEYLDNLISRGWLKNSMLGYLPSKGGVLDLRTGSMGTSPLGSLFFGKLQKAKRDKMLAELNRRGLWYNVGDEQKVVMPDTTIPDDAVQVSNLGFSEAEMAAANAAAIAQQSQTVQDQMNQSIQQSQQMGYGQGGGRIDFSSPSMRRDYSRSPGAIAGDMEYDEE
jgi:hypothetical protein